MCAAQSFFRLIRVPPNTAEWLEARKGRVGVAIGSSGIGAAAGANQFKARSVMLGELVHGSTFTGNAATEHGHRWEPRCAQQWSEWNGGVPVFEVGVCRPTRHNPHFRANNGYPYFGVSIDRWACASCYPSSQGTTEPDIRQHTACKGFRVIECKCPHTLRSFQRYYAAAGDRIKPDHLAQLHLQMAVLGLEHIDYMVALIDDDTGRVQRARWSRVTFDRRFWQWLYPRALDVALMAVQCLWSNEQALSSSTTLLSNYQDALDSEDYFRTMMTYVEHVPVQLMRAA